LCVIIDGNAYMLYETLLQDFTPFAVCVSSYGSTTVKGGYMQLCNLFWCILLYCSVQISSGFVYILSTAYFLCSNQITVNVIGYYLYQVNIVSQNPRWKWRCQ